MDRLWCEFEDIDYGSQRLSFRVLGAPKNATVMIPRSFGDLTVMDVLVDQEPVDFRTDAVDGIVYVLFLISEAECRVEVRYGAE